MNKRSSKSIKQSAIIMVLLVLVPLVALGYLALHAPVLSMDLDRDALTKWDLGWVATIAAVVAVAAVFIAAVVWWFVRRCVSDPIAQLTRHAGKDPDGKTDQRIDETRYPSELAPLARAFKEMSDQLQEREASRHLVEAALRERETRLRSLVGAAPVGVGVAVNDTLMEVNEQICRMTGYSQSDLIGQKTRTFYANDAEHRFANVEEYRQIRKHGTASVETRWQTKAGDTLEILLNSTPIDADNWASGVMFIALDITEKKQVEQALVTSNERFMTVLESIDANIYVADLETYEILFMNKNMIEDFGANLTGQNCWKALRNEDGPCDCCTNDRLVDEQGQPTGLCIWESANPVTGKWYLNYDRAIRWVDDRMARLQIATDISKIKELESERRRVEEQMHHSSKMEAIGTLAGGIAHDFNNLLGIIIGNAELEIDEVEPTSQIHQSLTQIRSAGLRAKDVVSQLLSFSRRIDSERVPLDLAPIIREGLKLIRASTPANIEIVSEIDSGLGKVMADAAQIHQLLINLCTNAAHSMPREGGLLTVRLARVDLDDDEAEEAGLPSEGRYLELSVADTGEGIEPENLDRIFDPYFTTKSVGKGTGMGLSVVHGIVSSHEGVVRVFSRVGKGSYFIVLLPLLDTEDNETQSDAGELMRGRGERILFVDDEPAMATMGKTILERIGYRADSETTPEAALAAFESDPERYDLMITDMTMPGMTGDRLTAAVRALRPDLPVILCTGFNENINGAKAKELGIDGYIEKPVDRHLLAETVRRLLARSANSGA